MCLKESSVLRPDWNYLKTRNKKREIVGNSLIRITVSTSSFLKSVSGEALFKLKVFQIGLH